MILKIGKDGSYRCPKCGDELGGDGKNHLECIECDFIIHEADIEN